MSSSTEEAEEIVVAANTKGGDSSTYHLPDGDGGPLCDTIRQRDAPWRTKPRNVYPPGTRRLCEHCRRVRDEETDDA